MSVTKLVGLDSIVEWQCAYDAIKHADPKQRVFLEYGTPQGDLTLVVTVLRNGAIRVTKMNRQE